MTLLFHTPLPAFLFEFKEGVSIFLPFFYQQEGCKERKGFIRLAFKSTSHKSNGITILDQNLQNIDHSRWGK